MRDRYASLREGLVGAWIPSVSGSGLLLPDLSGNGNNGALTNMDASDWVSSQYGRALDFDGVDDYVNVPDANQLDGFATATMCCFCQTGGGSFATVFAKGTQYSAYRNNAGNFRLKINNSNFDTTVSYASSALRHVCLRLDGTNCELFVDSIVSYTAAFSSALVPNATSLTIGSGFGYMQGVVDDIRIYNRALSESEIKLLASRPGIGLRPQRRTMYYAPPVATGARRRRILTSMP